MKVIFGVLAVAALAAPAMAAVNSTTVHDVSSTGLNGQIAIGDALSGLIATELAGDQGWHGANNDPLDRLPAFTDDAGIRGTGLTGLLNDFPAGAPAKRIQYDLTGPTLIGEIRVLTGNNGRDGRVFSTFTVSASTNNGGSFSPIGYFQSDPLGSVNNGNTPDAVRWGSTLVTVYDDASPVLAAGVTNLQFEFFAVDNTQGQYVDPFNGVNPFTGLDDLFPQAISSPLVFEIDVLAIPEPASLALGAAALAGLAVWRRR